MKNSADRGGCYPPRPKAEVGFGRLCSKKKAYYAFSSAHMF